MNIKLLFYTFLLCFIISSCKVRDVEVLGVEDYRIENLMSSSENPRLYVDIKIDNPNNFNIKIKKADLKLFVGASEIGDIKLVKRVKIPKNSINVQTFVIEPSSRKLFAKSLMKTVGSMFSGSIEVSVKGRVKGSVWGIGKWMDVNEKQRVNLSDLIGF